MDSVVADFEAGAAEMLSPDAPAHHWDVIEGQGSLFHPAYAGRIARPAARVSQPDVIVVCHEPGRTHMLGYPGYPMPDIAETIELNLRLGRRTNPAIRCAGVSLNTSGLGADEAARMLSRESERLGVPGRGPDARRPAVRAPGRCLSRDEHVLNTNRDSFAR